MINFTLAPPNISCSFLFLQAVIYTISGKFKSAMGQREVQDVKSGKDELNGLPVLGFVSNKHHAATSQRNDAYSEQTGNNSSWNPHSKNLL
jgi:hypothetical protein